MVFVANVYAGRTGKRQGYVVSENRNEVEGRDFSEDEGGSSASVRAQYKLGVVHSRNPWLDFVKLWYEELDVKTVFMYRLCINVRAFMYTYLAIFYDMKIVYLEVQLIRIIMSWIGSFILCWVHPGFIKATPGEVKVVFHPVNLGLKFIGTAMSISALYLINK